MVVPVLIISSTWTKQKHSV